MSDQTCRPFRISIPELTYKVKALTGLPEKVIADTLAAPNFEPFRIDPKQLDKIGASSRNDKLSDREKRLGFDAKTSISAAEADRYIFTIRRFIPAGENVFTEHPKDKIAYALNVLFFNGQSPYEDKGAVAAKSAMIFYRSTPGHDDPLCGYWDTVAFDPKSGGCYCHDADTCNVAVKAPDGCTDKGLFGYDGPSRELMVDAPERGDIVDTPAMRKWIGDKFRNSQGAGYAPAYINQKQLDGIFKTFPMYIKDPKKMTPNEVFLTARLIIAHSGYDGDIAMFFANDLADHATKRSDPKEPAFFTRESFIRFTCEDTPNWLCGHVQRYDRYLRILAAPNVNDENVFLGYFRDRLPNSIKDFSAKTQIYQITRAEVEKRANELIANTKNPELLKLAKDFGPDKLYKPEDLYNKDTLAYMAKGMKSLFTKYPGLENDYNTSMTLVKTMMGIVYPYQKYRNENFPIFRDAGMIAAQNHVAFWRVSKTFNDQWTTNLKNPRHFPPDCTTGKQ